MINKYVGTCLTILILSAIGCATAPQDNNSCGASGSISRELTLREIKRADGISTAVYSDASFFVNDVCPESSVELKYIVSFRSPRTLPADMSVESNAAVRYPNRQDSLGFVRTALAIDAGVSQDEAIATLPSLTSDGSRTSGVVGGELLISFPSKRTTQEDSTYAMDYILRVTASMTYVRMR